MPPPQPPSPAPERPDAAARSLFGVAVTSADGRVVEANDAFREIAGLTAAQVASGVVRLGEFRGASPIAAVPAPMEYVRADGTAVPVLAAKSPVASEPARTSWHVADLSRVRRREDLLRATVEASPTAVVMVDPSGDVVLVNAIAERVLGWPAAELLGRPAEVLVPERLRAAYAEFRAGFLAEPRARVVNAGTGLSALRRDGREVAVDVGISPLRTDDGTFALVAVVDVTERRRSRIELVQSNEEAAAFVSTVAHDLRAPLVNLQGFSRELGASCTELRALADAPDVPAAAAARIRAILDGDVAGALRHIHASARKSEALIQALLDLARSARAELRCEELDVSAAVAATLDALQPAIRSAGASVDAGPLPRAWGDATAIGRVFTNLVSNAVKYLQPGRPGRIEIAGEAAADGSRRYSVRDNGVGIPADARPRVFRIFQRFHPSLAPGEGLGLAIVQRIVERHGGRVWFESREGAGSTFHFTLPGRDAQSA